MRPRVWAPRGRLHLCFRPNSHHHKATGGCSAMPIPLSAPEFVAIVDACAALLPSDRAAFLGAVVGELDGRFIGDGTIGRAIAAVQARFSHPEPARNRAGAAISRVSNAAASAR